MGKIISLVGQKGGTGKTTIAQNLAVYFAIRFAQVKNNQEVCLLDADDPQWSTSEWGERRNDNSRSDLVKISFYQKSGTIMQAIKDLATKYALVIVDCGGHDDFASRSALKVSDLCIFPTRPKNRDTRAIINMSNLIKLEQMTQVVHARSLLNQCPTNPKQAQSILDTKAVNRSWDLEPLHNIIYSREDYDRCDESGVGALEYSNPAAKQEIGLVGAEIESILGIKI